MTFFMKVRTVLKYAMQYKISKIVNKIYFFCNFSTKVPIQEDSLLFALTVSNSLWFHIMYSNSTHSHVASYLPSDLATSLSK